VKWISVQDSMPAIGTYCLLKDMHGYIEMGLLLESGEFTSACGIFDHGCGCCGGDDTAVITHWIEMTEGPYEMDKC